MKNVYEVLRQKELEVSRLKREVEGLRIAAPLLSEGEEPGKGNPPRLATSTAGSPLCFDFPSWGCGGSFCEYCYDYHGAHSCVKKPVQNESHPLSTFRF